MKVAVLTLTRDRLEYSRHCFQQLHDLAGCDFDHYVFDQGSQDGTAKWLAETYDPDYLVLHHENVGISRAMNRLLDMSREVAAYDVVVKFDNDCEVTTEDVLRDCAGFVLAHPEWLISPRIEGLNEPPGTLDVIELAQGRVLVKGQIGGIFLAANAGVYEGFRYDEGNPIWGMDDVQICRGRRCGYLDAHVANHYETTVGQAARYPDYFERKYAEFTA